MSEDCHVDTPALAATGTAYLHTPNLIFIVKLLKHHKWLSQFPEHIAVRSEHDNCVFLERSGYSCFEIKPFRTTTSYAICTRYLLCQ